MIRSTDSGASWQPIRVNWPTAHTPPDLRALVRSPSGDALIAAGPPGAILRSNADGSAWEVKRWTSMESERAIPWVLVDEKRARLLAIESRGALQLSRDDGMIWETREVALPAGGFPLWQGAVLESASVMVAAGDDGRVVRSADAGDSWQIIDAGVSQDLFGSYADADKDLMFLLGAQGTILRSTSQGAQWTSVASGSSEELRRMFRDARTGALLCMGTHGALLRSTDDGLTWKPITSGTDGVLRKPFVEPGTGHLLIAGSQGTLLRSTDGGRTWARLDTHTARHFNSLASDKQTGDLVLVGERIVRLVRQSSRAKSPN
jgi:photosystem II stability/assembly factor-like uncharacterized protein